MNLKDFLKDKKVILVGPSESLLKNKNKEFIESFDVIVRVNRGIEPTDKYEEYIGERTDILYNCMLEHPDNGGIIDADYFSCKKVKFVVYHPEVDFYGKALNKDPSHLKPTTIQKLKNNNIYLNKINFEFYNKISSQVKCRPNTGYIAIFDLLNYDVKELYITGFTFYLDKFMPGYKDQVDKEEFKSKCFVSQRHNQKNLWAFLKKSYAENSKLKVDPYLHKILGLKKLKDDPDIKSFVFS
tara:strand:- start:14189 stop:14911 length:723 start_codon:yes stop_codon:yes gene_type:complete